MPFPHLKRLCTSDICHSLSAQCREDTKGGNMTIIMARERKTTWENRVKERNSNPEVKPRVQIVLKTRNFSKAIEKSDNGSLEKQ